MENKRLNSKKRGAIYELLRNTKDHPTAEMIYNRLKPLYPELSLGTVYRNLAILTEEGLVVSVGKVDGQERYDARLDLHAHFVCSRCHRVTDIELTPPEFELLGKLDGRLNGDVEFFTLTVQGICPECQNKDVFPCSTQ